MISASQMIYASRMMGTDIISYLRAQIYHTALAVYHIANGDISLKNIAFYDIMPLKEGAFISEN